MQYFGSEESMEPCPFRWKIEIRFVQSDAPRAKPLSNSTTQFGRFFSASIEKHLPGCCVQHRHLSTSRIWQRRSFNGRTMQGILNHFPVILRDLERYEQLSGTMQNLCKIFARKRTMPSHPEMMSRSQLQAV